MYDLHKIIIMGSYDINDEESIETVVMETDGMKILKILYINKVGFTGDKKQLKSEIISELYDDMYDKDDLDIKIKEAYNGEDCMQKVAKFLSKIWKDDCLLYFYKPSESCFKYLSNLLINIDGHIDLQNYNIICEDQYDIVQIMEDNGLKIENLIKDNSINYIYFLMALVERLYSR